MWAGHGDRETQDDRNLEEERKGGQPRQVGQSQQMYSMYFFLLLCFWGDFVKPVAKPEPGREAN
jgi:hypothetical protein